MIHDFCLGIPYGIFLAVGGCLGFLLSGSKVSLSMGMIIGGIVLIASQKSMLAYKQGYSSPPSTFVGLLMSVLTTGVMGKRFRDTGALFPAGITLVVSLAMALFYLQHCIAFRRGLKQVVPTQKKEE